MKRFLLTLTLLTFIAGAFGIYGQNYTRPVLKGHTFTSSNGETLDFYDDSVIYHAEGSDISRKGDYKIGAVGNIGSPMTCDLTVNIYVSDRIVTLKGRVEYYRSGELLRLVLNGTKYEYSY